MLRYLISWSGTLANDESYGGAASTSGTNTTPMAGLTRKSRILNARGLERQMSGVAESVYVRIGARLQIFANQFF
jgi:hypothetical protein